MLLRSAEHPEISSEDRGILANVGFVCFISLLDGAVFRLHGCSSEHGYPVTSHPIPSSLIRRSVKLGSQMVVGTLA
jgi:hypothetical protein